MYFLTRQRCSLKGGCQVANRSVRLLVGCVSVSCESHIAPQGKERGIGWGYSPIRVSPRGFVVSNLNGAPHGGLALLPLPKQLRL